MSICHGCGGVIGRDCFNPQECEQITRTMAAEYQSQPNYEYQINELTKENELIKSASKELLTAMEQVHFFIDGYKNGSASISEINDAQDKELEAYSKLWNLVNKKP